MFSMIQLFLTFVQFSQKEKRKPTVILKMEIMAVHVFNSFDINEALDEVIPKNDTVTKCK